MAQETRTDDIRFEGANGIYKVFVRCGDAHVYERTIATAHSATTRAAKLEALRESRDNDPVELID